MSWEGKYRPRGNLAMYVCSLGRQIMDSQCQSGTYAYVQTYRRVFSSRFKTLARSAPGSVYYYVYDSPTVQVV